jgi:type IV pilus assembly protein PilN
MPRINLLPVKAARRQEQARTQLLMSLAGLALVCLIVYLWNVSVQMRTSRIEKQIDTLNQTLAKLTEEVKRVEMFKAQAQVLEQKINVIETLKKMKSGPAKLLDNLATILTNHEKVWVTSISEVKGILSLEGAAMDHEDISEFQLDLQKHPVFFTGVHLEMVSTKEETGRRYLIWKITCIANYAAG